MANGSTSFKLVLIFYGKGTVAKRESYNDRVDVYFNETAYNTEKLFHRWLQDIYQPWVAQTANAGEESLIVMDVTASSSLIRA
jgi:hypothetical protein